MALSDRLAGRSLPRVTVPIQVSDPGEDLRRRQAEAVAVAERAVALVEVGGDAGVGEDVAAALVAEAQRLTDEIAVCFADVVLQAAPPAVWEQVVIEHSDVDEESGSWDLTGSALPAMLAVCAVGADEDPSLGDPAWWAEQLASWPKGDADRLRVAVLEVNAPDAFPLVRALGKG